MDAVTTKPVALARPSAPASTASTPTARSATNAALANGLHIRKLTALERAAIVGQTPTSSQSTVVHAPNTALALRLQSAEQKALAADAAKVAALLPKMLCALGGVDDLTDLGVRPLVASAGTESLFNCLFGRDSIRMAIDMIDTHPAVAKSTIEALAKLQGVRVNPKAEEEPGRIIHEFRSAEEVAKIRPFEPNIDNWDFPYYGSVDATLRFVDLVSQYVEQRGPAVLDENINVDAQTNARFGQAPRTIRDAVSAAVGFIERRLHDPRAGGFVYVERANPKGIQNQILEDSFDSVYDENGKLHPTTLPYAPVAEQGYAYRALKDASRLLHRPELSDEADALQQRFATAFWQEDLGTFAQAVGFDADGHGSPMRTIASSPAQLLGTGILDNLEAQRRKMVARLFEPDMLAGAGIRTKSTEAARFRAGGYHNGTVWPTISLEIADGLRRTEQIERARGRDDEARDLEAKATDLEDRAIHACAKFPFFPEFFRGDVDGSIAINTEVIRDKDRDGVMNTLEQPPQPQGWTATALARILERRGLFDSSARSATQQAAE
jgi:glycogen debranching enzyme